MQNRVLFALCCSSSNFYFSFIQDFIKITQKTETQNTFSQLYQLHSPHCFSWKENFELSLHLTMMLNLIIIPKLLSRYFLCFCVTVLDYGPPFYWMIVWWKVKCWVSNYYAISQMYSILVIYGMSIFRKVVQIFKF